jgi:subtilase family serine protease
MRQTILISVVFPLLGTAATHHVTARQLAATSVPLPPTDADCRQSYGFPCYSPQEMQIAYGLAPLLQAGYNGAGQTIILIESFGSPTIQQDLQIFDAAYGLPDPPSFTVLAPLGSVPFNHLDPEQVIWAQETSADVEWAHAMAPGANIVVLTSPVDFNNGLRGLPEFLQLEQYALDHHLGQIISQSWGITENVLLSPGGQEVLDGFQRLYLRAALENVTVIAASGDSGSANVDASGHYYPFPTVLFPASSPLVIAVGGTSLKATTQGEYQSETVWNDNYGASGGGVSRLFPERGLPDVAYNADPNTPVVGYFGFYLNPANRGYYTLGGTSAAAPQWAAFVADANQLAGRPLGFLNPKLFSLGISDDCNHVFHDITVGNNSFVTGVAGYAATPGWDLTTGWGTPKLAALIPELARQR